MSAAKPTTGPFRIANCMDDHGTSVVSDGAKGLVIGWFGTGSTVGVDGRYSISADEARANAKLFVAAPKLLEALRTCAGRVCMAEGVNAPAYQQAAALIRDLEAGQ